MSKHSYTLYSDGGARGNPGPAAIGGVLMQGDQLIDSFSVAIGHATNNQAEYRAIIRGLECAVKKGVTDVNCLLDSELVVKQLNGEYRVKDADLKLLHEKALTLADSFNTVSFAHIPREKNKQADALVNKALDA